MASSTPTTTMAEPRMVFVPVSEGHKAMPAALRERLETNNNKPCELLAADIAKAMETGGLLRATHLESIKENAGRYARRVDYAAVRRKQQSDEAARASEAALEARGKVEARRAVQIHERTAGNAERREALAEAVLESRRAADAEAARKGAEHAERVDKAGECREKQLRRLVERSSVQVRHALQVAGELKQKKIDEMTSLGKKVDERLLAAEARRTEKLQAQQEKAAERASEKGRAVATSRHDQDFVRKLQQHAATAAAQKATAKREAALGARVASARAANAHAEEVSEAAKAAAEVPSAEAKKALMGRLVAADVNRNLALKARAEHTSCPGESATARTNFHPEVIVVPTSGAAGTTSSSYASSASVPPMELIRRLSLTPKTLLATSAARQLGAFARRETKGTAWHQRTIDRSVRIAKAAEKRARARAALIAPLEAREARASALASVKAKHAESLAVKNHALRAMVDANLRAAEEELLAKAVDNAIRVEHASEEKDAQLRKKAKKGVSAVRAAAAKSRRSLLDQTSQSRSELLSARCAEADETRGSLLATRMQCARHMGEMRPEAAAAIAIE
jgi:hypothetical protein